MIDWFDELVNEPKPSRVQLYDEVVTARHLEADCISFHNQTKYSSSFLLNFPPIALQKYHGPMCREYATAY